MSTHVELGHRLGGLRERMAKEELDVLLLASVPARRDVLSGSGSGTTGIPFDPLVVVGADGTLTLTGTDPEDVAGALAGTVGTLGVDAAVPARLQARIAEQAPGWRIRPADDVVFAELAVRPAAERVALAAAAGVADVGYTAVMDHLHVGQPVQEITDNVARSTRRAGGGSGWAPPERAGDPGAGSALVTVRGAGGDERLTPATPVRYALHPLLDGHAGLATATAVLSRADPALRALGDRAAAAFRELVGGLRSGERLAAGPDAFRRSVTDGVRSARARVVTLAGGTAGPALPHDSAVLAEDGMVLGVETVLVGDDGRAVEFGGVVVLSGAAELITVTPVRLVELY